jgi:soluble lytic murein transglycosylase-like protein
MLLLVTSSVQAQTQTVDVLGDGGSHTAVIARWQAEINNASRRFDIPEAWISAVIRAESGGNTLLNGHPITSPKGAMGLMQVMPDTYAEMRRLHGLGPDPFAPQDNILAGTAYLRLNFDRLGYPGLFAAYNAGPDRYSRSLLGNPLPLETRNYVASLVKVTSRQSAAPASVFVPLEAPVEGSRSSLFVTLTGQ